MQAALRIVIFLLIIVAVVVAASHFSGMMRDATVDIDTVQLDPHRTIRISSKLHTDGNAAMFYQVIVDGEALGSPAFFAFALPRGIPPTFEAVQSENGGLIGIVQAAAPHAVLVLHDFDANTSWPQIDDGQVTAEAKAMLERLHDAHTTLEATLTEPTQRMLVATDAS